MIGEKVTRNILKAFEREINCSKDLDNGMPDKSLLDSLMNIEG
jgi:hypothetical protein